MLRSRPCQRFPAAFMVICMLQKPFRLANLNGMRAGRVVRHWVGRPVSADGTVRE